MIGPYSSSRSFRAGFMAHHVVILGIYLGWANPLTLFGIVGSRSWRSDLGLLDRRHGTILEPGSATAL